MLIHEDLVRRISGCPTIPSRHQLMIALWKMAFLKLEATKIATQEILLFYAISLILFE